MLDKSKVVKAYEALTQKLLLNPDDPEALVTQAALLLDNADLRNAQYYVWLARRAYNNAPNNISVLFNLGVALLRIGRFEQAAEMFVLCTDTDDRLWYANSLHYLGIAHRALGQDKRAIEYYEKALELLPERLDIKKDLAIALLADRQWLRGLEAFEVRKDTAYEKLARNDGELIGQHKLPDGKAQWKGEDLAGKSIVVYHEEGTGDLIMVSRFIPMLRERGAVSVKLMGPVPSLLELVAANVAVDGIVPLAGPFECDYIVGSMSVPWRCGARYEDIDGNRYFSSDAAEFPLRSLLNVGLVWRGNPAYPRDFERSMPLSTLSPLFEIPGVAFYSLQVGDAVSEIDTLGLRGFIADLEAYANDNDWSGTARLIKRLDAIVTIDTAVAHLAGALGVPVFIMIANNCDWRWDRENERTQWYESARVIRQHKQNDWSICIARVKRHLEDMVNARRQAGGSSQQGAAGLRAAE